MLQSVAPRENGLACLSQGVCASPWLMGKHKAVVETCRLCFQAAGEHCRPSRSADWAVDKGCLVPGSSLRGWAGGWADASGKGQCRARNSECFGRWTREHRHAPESVQICWRFLAGQKKCVQTLYAPSDPLFMGFVSLLEAFHDLHPLQVVFYFSFPFFLVGWFGFCFVWDGSVGIFFLLLRILRIICNT